MVITEKKSRLESLLAPLPKTKLKASPDSLQTAEGRSPEGSSGGKVISNSNDYLLTTNTYIMSDYENTTENPDVKQKNKRLQGLASTPVSLVKKRFSSPDPIYPLAHGWYCTGVVRGRIYKVEELYSWYRIQHRLHRGTIGPAICSAQDYHFKRKHVLAWLQAEGWKSCEQIIEYGIQNWEPLRIRYNIDAEEPFFFILYGFRKAITREMNRTVEKTWGADYTPTEDNCGEARVEMLSW